MAKVSLLNIFDDLVRTSDVLNAGIEKGIHLISTCLMIDCPFEKCV